MSHLILDIETIPLPPIDKEVEEFIAKKIQARIEKTGDDPENVAQSGDTVRIIEARQLSKLKRWRLVEVTKKSEEIKLG